MSRKIACLFLGLALLVSGVMTGYAYEPEATDPYVVASVQLADTGVAQMSDAVITDGHGLAMVMDLAATERSSTNLSLSQLATRAALIRQEQAQATAAAEAQAIANASLLAAYDGVMIQCSDSLNIRAEASMGGKVIRSLRNGKVGHLVGISPDGKWYQINYGKTTGYISVDYAQPVHYADYEGTPATSTLREEIVEFAKTYLGTPYVFGGTSYRGIDCSGFTMRVYGHFGISLNHAVTSQYRRSQIIPQSELEPGDLVFFGEGGDPLTHIGIYVGNGGVIHASSTNGVIISSLSSSYYRSHYTYSGRILIND